MGVFRYSGSISSEDCIDKSLFILSLRLRVAPEFRIAETNLLYYFANQTIEEQIKNSSIMRFKVQTISRIVAGTNCKRHKAWTS